MSYINLEWTTWNGVDDVLLLLHRIQWPVLPHFQAMNEYCQAKVTFNWRPVVSLVVLAWKPLCGSWPSAMSCQYDYFGISPWPPRLVTGQFCPLSKSWSLSSGSRFTVTMANNYIEYSLRCIFLTIHCSTVSTEKCFRLCSSVSQFVGCDQNLCCVSKLFWVDHEISSWMYLLLTHTNLMSV